MRKINRKKGKSASSDEPMMEINTTPLIDVMLVLLVMLIITIPVQLHHVKLDMPTSSSTTNLIKPEVISIEIDQFSIINWNGLPIEDEQDLVRRLQEQASIQDQPEIHLRANRLAKYKVVAEVLSAIQNAGLNKLGVAGLEEYAK